MNKKIRQKVLKEWYRPDATYYKIELEKAILRTIELMEEEFKKQIYFKICDKCEKQKADFRKMIELEKIIVRRMCLGLIHPSERNQKEFAGWLQKTVNFHLSQILLKLGDDKEVKK